MTDDKREQEETKQDDHVLEVHDGYITNFLDLLSGSVSKPNIK